jgi:hypothetical protein
MLRMKSQRKVGVVVAGAVGTLSLVLTGAGAGAQNNDGTPVAPESVTASETVTAAGTGNIALFFDSNYVDTDSGGSGEAENLRQTLTTQGFSVNTFTGTTTAEWQAALAGVKTMVLPELEKSAPAATAVGDLEDDLEPGALAALQGYIAGGGKFVTFSERNWNFLEAVFGQSADSIAGNGGCPCTITAAATGTEFAGGPTSLASLDDTQTVTVGTFPTGTINVYEDDEESGDAGVSRTSVGDGCVEYLGWDWFFEEGQDRPPWFDVLDRAVDAPCGPARPGPEPAPTPVTVPEPVAAQPRFTG